MDKRITIVGLGYVGLTMAVCLAEKGIATVGLDSDKKKIELINNGSSPFYEPQLETMISRALDSGTLKIVDDYQKALRDSYIIFITVGTPSLSDGSINLEQINSVINSIGKITRDRKSYYLIVIRSTVTPGTTGKIIKPILESTSGRTCGKDFGLCTNPEFLKEGSSVQDMLGPDRIIIGEHDKKSGNILEDFYRQFYFDNMPNLIRTSLENAELIKYVNNAFLATKISFINSIANLCEKIPNSDVEVIARGIGLDPRISPLFLKAGLGWGGSCLPKDLKAVLNYSRKQGLDLPIVDAALRINESQPILAIDKARKALGGLKGKNIAILGLAFKPNTDDVRNAVSIRIIDKFLMEGAIVRAFDPVANENMKQIFGERIYYASSIEDCIKGTDCCVIVTEWEIFKNIRSSNFKALMKRPLIIDGRKIFDKNEFKNDLEYFAIGSGE